MKIWNSTITMINLTNHKNNEEHVHHFNVSRSAFSETFDGQVDIQSDSLSSESCVHSTPLF